MARLDRLTEVDERYAYYDGFLVFESDTGDTLLPPHPGRWTFLPPHPGRWTFLESVEDREDAVEAARAWKEQE